jgi:hypothetical protein
MTLIVVPYHFLFGNGDHRNTVAYMLMCWIWPLIGLLMLWELVERMMQSHNLK